MATKTPEEDLLQKIKELETQVLALQRVGAQIENQNQFLRLILESLPHPFYVIDTKDYTVKMANAAARLEQRQKNSTCYALTHGRTKPCDGERHACPLAIVTRTHKPAIVEHVHYDPKGHPRDVEVHAFPLFDPEGNVSQIIEYCRDITERKKIERELQESELKFRSVAQSAIDAIISSDQRGNIVFWNSAAHQMFGYTEKEIMGRPLTALMPVRFREMHKQALRHQDPAGTAQSGVIGKTVELVGLNQDGREFPIELSLSTWRIGADVFYTSVIRDISKRRQIEKERDQLIQSLQESLAKVKTLRGLLPICASCKKIRDDNGYWNQLDAYIRSHSDVQFTHGICPECAQKLYPEYYQK
ncbi:MAG: PAS domain S-box protein [Desulfobacterales bacterium]|nr:MAG: PAS domain S-box protein [Desulfobacterales bacterium]